MGILSGLIKLKVAKKGLELIKNEANKSRPANKKKTLGHFNVLCTPGGLTI